MSDYNLDVLHVVDGGRFRIWVMENGDGGCIRAFEVGVRIVWWRPCLVQRPCLLPELCRCRRRRPPAPAFRVRRSSRFPLAPPKACLGGNWRRKDWKEWTPSKAGTRPRRRKRRLRSLVLGDGIQTCAISPECWELNPF